MSERFPDYQRLTIASAARDITLRYGEPVTNPDTGNGFVVSKWDDTDKDQGIWHIALISEGLYSSSNYLLDFKSMTTSDVHRYAYDIRQDRFTHESPLGSFWNTNEAGIASNMHGWLAKRATPDALRYDAQGTEQDRQRTFEEIGAAIAIRAALDMPEGRDIFMELTSTRDQDRINRLHTEFYNLSRWLEDSFYTGAAATRTALEALINEVKPREQQPASQPDLPII